MSWMGMPTPRDTKQKWMAFGAILAVIVGVSWASHAFKRHLEKTLPQAADSTEPALPVESPPLEPEEPDGDPPPADDEPPRQPSSIEASIEGRPAWSPAGSYAPDHSDARIVYLLGTRIDVPLSRRVAACSIVAFDAETTAGGELEVRVRVGSTPERFARGENGVVWIVVPLASLAIGESVAVRASLRRGDKVSDLARTSAKLTGGELSFRLPPAPGADHAALDIECRALATRDADDQIARDAGRADAALRRLATPKLDVAKDDWGYPIEDFARARRSTSDVAALAGWGDPRAKKRVASLVAAQARFDAAGNSVFEHLRRSATKTALVADLEVTFDSLSCAQRCTANLTVKNPTAADVAWGGDGAPRTYIATNRGGPRFFGPDANAPKVIAAGSNVPVTATLPDALPANEPAILGICASSRCSMLLVR